MFRGNRQWIRDCNTISSICIKDSLCSSCHSELKASISTLPIIRKKKSAFKNNKTQSIATIKLINYTTDKKILVYILYSNFENYSRYCRELQVYHDTEWRSSYYIGVSRYMKNDITSVVVYFEPSEWRNFFVIMIK